MIKSQQFKSFAGFGDGSKYSYGEYVHSQGMHKSLNGIMPLWNVLSETDSSSLSGLGLVPFFAQALQNGSIVVFAVDTNGVIYSSSNGTGTWQRVHNTAETSHGNGLIGTQNGQLFYPQTRYLGRYDGSAPYTTGTIQVIHGDTTINGTGTTFTADMEGSVIVINGVSYTVATYVSAVLIFLSTNYAGTSAPSVSFSIYQGWDDTFHDFGASSLTVDSDFRDADTYEDLVVICNGHALATYNVDTDTFAAEAFTVSSKDLARSVRSGRNGILVGINRGNRGAFFLWDGNSDRSISPWTWTNGKIQSIASDNGDWIVITDREILLTNGYTTQLLTPSPDNLVGQLTFNVLPQGAQVAGNFLIMSNTEGLTNRIRCGYWILDLTTKLWEYAPVANLSTIDNIMGAVFLDSNAKLHTAWSSQIPNTKYIGSIVNSQPTSAYFITPPLGDGNGQKVGTGLKLNLGISPYQTANYPITFNVSVKIYNFKRPLWTYAQQKVLASVDHNKLTVDGTQNGINNAQVGDEVTIMEGTNAGQVVHISSISGANTSTEIWTLDRNLTGFTEQDVFIQVMPFQLIKTHSLSNLTELKELYFNCKNKIKGQKFLLKILLDSIGNVPPELLEGEFIYDDLVVITTN